MERDDTPYYCALPSFKPPYNPRPKNIYTSK